MPRALRTWFAPDPEASGGGHDIVYDERRASQLARLADAPVVSYPTETAVADLGTAELQVVTPQATVETYTPPAVTTPSVIETPSPMTSSTTTPEEMPQTSSTTTPMEMPRTASRIPLIALLGTLFVGGAVALRLARPA
jgi:hypothetical protein